MIDPLTITTGCVSLLGGLTALSKQITSFAVVAHGARSDMEAFSKEIASLSPCLEALRQPDLIGFYPDALRPNLVTIIRECDGVTGKMRQLLTKLSSGSAGRRMQWSFTARDEADRLRQSLEAHKSALQIAISLVSLSATQSLQNDTSSIRAKAALIPQMREDTAQIADLRREIAALRVDMNLQQVGLSVPMQRFLEESTAYADSVCGEMSGLDEPATHEMRLPSPDICASFGSSSHLSLERTDDSEQADENVPVAASLEHHDGTTNTTWSLSKFSEKTEEVQRSELDPNSEPAEVLVGGDSWSGVMDRNVEKAKEVECQLPWSPELSIWASEFHEAVRIASAEGLFNYRIQILTSVRAAFSLRTIFMKREIKKAESNIQRLLKARRAFAVTDAELMTILVITSEQPYASCRTLLDSKLETDPCDLGSASSRQRFVLMQQAIKLYHRKLVYCFLEKIKHLDINEEVLQTAVCCGNLEIVRILLTLCVPREPVSSTDPWLGSCYIMWLYYILATRTSLCQHDGHDDHLMADIEAAWSTKPNIASRFRTSEKEGPYDPGSKAVVQFVVKYEDLMQAHENGLREAVGLPLVEWQARTSENRANDIRACAQYLLYKIEAYEKEPWNLFKSMGFY